MKVWYKFDLRPCSWGLLWSASPGVLVFLLAAILKLLRYNPPPVTGFPLNQTLEPVELDELPSKAQQALRAVIDECGKHSFRLAYCFSTENLGDAESYLASMLHAGGRIRGAAFWSHMGKNIECGCSFATRFENGDIYSTSNVRRSGHLPPGMHLFSLPGASVAEIFSRHQQLLERLGEEAAVTLAPEQLPEELNEQLRRTHAYLMARGALKPMTQAEIDRLTIVKAELVPEPSDNPFRSPLSHEVATAPRRRSVWRAMFNGACYGGLLGALAGLLFRQPAAAPVNPNRAELLWLVANYYGWFFLPALAGAFLGWLSWRRAKDRAALTSLD
ncbi:MAG TPA: hypothetical protein VMV10_14065 [Pirellulales bacterium]|nr:hypothetical protein [Pirellulales bacterium]